MEEIIEKVCGSDLREKIRMAIKKKYKEDPLDRFRIITSFNSKKNEGKIYEVQVQWDKYDLEILSIIIMEEENN